MTSAIPSSTLQASPPAFLPLVMASAAPAQSEGNDECTLVAIRSRYFEGVTLSEVLHSLRKMANPTGGDFLTAMPRQELWGPLWLPYACALLMHACRLVHYPGEQRSGRFLLGSLVLIYAFAVLEPWAMLSVLRRTVLKHDLSTQERLSFVRALMLVTYSWLYLAVALASLTMMPLFHAWLPVILMTMASSLSGTAVWCSLRTVFKESLHMSTLQCILALSLWCTVHAMLFLLVRLALFS
jgi:hypothetical protein